MKLVWHYTNGLVIDEIVTEGVIKLATAGLPRTEQAAAWFSTNPLAAARLDQFKPNPEVLALEVIYEPQDLAFPIHTEAAHRFFSQVGP